MTIATTVRRRSGWPHAAGWPTRGHLRARRGRRADSGRGPVLVRNLFMSVDPAMRGRMNDAKSYAPPFEVGEVM